MKTQITQKKVLKLRTTPGAGEGEIKGEEPPPAPDTLKPPPQQAQAVVAASESFTWAAILSIVAVICFIVLLVLQWVEFQDISSAFPMKQAITAAR